MFPSGEKNRIFGHLNYSCSQHGQSAEQGTAITVGSVLITKNGFNNEKKNATEGECELKYFIKNNLISLSLFLI